MLPRHKSKNISLGPDRYRYVVAEAKPGDGSTVVPLVVTIQHEMASGAMLRVTGLTATRVPVEESKWRDGRTVDRPLLPPQIAGLIARAKSLGWIPDNPGPPFIMHVQNEDVFVPDVSGS